MVYNDAFATLLGHKHPGGVRDADPAGRGGGLGPAERRVRRSCGLEKGEGFLEDGVQLRLRRGRDRNRDVDTGYYLRAGSPCGTRPGGPGVLHIVLETTKGVERIQAVAGLASSLAVAVTVDDVCKAALHHALAGCRPLRP